MTKLGLTSNFKMWTLLRFRWDMLFHPLKPPPGYPPGSPLAGLWGPRLGRYPAPVPRTPKRLGTLNCCLAAVSVTFLNFKPASVVLYPPSDTSGRILFLWSHLVANNLEQIRHIVLGTSLTSHLCWFPNKGIILPHGMSLERDMFNLLQWWQIECWSGIPTCTFSMPVKAGHSK